MKKTGFRKPTYQEKLAKQRKATERAVERKRKKKNHPTRSSKLASKRVKVAKGSTKHPKPKSLSKYKKDLDSIFSKYIRQRDKGQCFTCSKKGDPKKMQNGHFVPRQYLAVRFNEKNCNCQCYACNMLYGGQGATYAIRLAEKYGQETVEWLESQRWVTVKLNVAWYQEKIEHYKACIG